MLGPKVRRGKSWSLEHRWEEGSLQDGLRHCLSQWKMPEGQDCGTHPTAAKPLSARLREPGEEHCLLHA